MMNIFGGGEQTRGGFREIAEDLMKLEVNTIIQTSLMTARKAPRPSQALLDIAGEYQNILTSKPPDGYGLKLQQAVRSHVVDNNQWIIDKADASEEVKVHGSTFRNLYMTAREGLKELGAQSDESGGGSQKEVREAVLWRIRRSCVDIATILERLEFQSLEPAERQKITGEKDKLGEGRDPGWAFGLTRREINAKELTRRDVGGPDIELTSREWIMIRKVWEISIEQIAMQTVIQLDGDVVTRLCRSHATEKHAHLWKAHMDSTQVAMDSWRFLVETVGNFLSASAKLVRGK
jgi:hypothetical protein